MKNLRGDILGGVTAGIVALPLALAFGVTAFSVLTHYGYSLEEASSIGAKAGLYGAIGLSILAAIFGGTATQISGPTAPMVIRGPGGAAKQLSAQHSHSLEGWFAHVPGLKVVAPATPADAYGLFKAAVRDDNPVIFTENPGLYGVKGEVPDDPDFTVEIGKAQVLREGTDVSLVTYSRMVHECLAAAETLDENGISAEVVDVRSLLPLDMETISASVSKTSRAVVVYEDWRSGGFGAEIAARIGERCFDDLDAPVGRVGGLNVPMPYTRNLELECIPNPDNIIAAVQNLS
ncbi:MAG: hypothetical protein IH945_12170 [Armatimonadetes bacterium]|nr:hypothetical protein [Armatimonadota bacterium]